MRLLSTTLLLLSFNLLVAQGKVRSFKADSGTVVIYYFTDGKVSTRAWTHGPECRQEGKSWAYDHDGRVLVEWSTRRYAGHSSMDCTYHPNGAVNKVEVSTAPDGGIQWYRGTYTFDENGKQLSFWEQGHDNEGPIPRLETHIVTHPQVKDPSENEVLEEQRLFINEVFVVNPTRSACRVFVTPNQPSPALTGGAYTMAPGDTLRVGMYSMGEIFQAPDHHLTMDINQVELERRKKVVARTRIDQVQASTEHRRYYYVIEGWITGKENEPQSLPVPTAPGKKGNSTKEKKKRRWLFFG